MLTDGYNKIVLPKLGLICLQNLDYISVVLEVQRRNSAASFSECKMQRIWQGLVNSVYHYELESARKKNWLRLTVDQLESIGMLSAIVD